MAKKKSNSRVPAKTKDAVEYVIKTDDRFQTVIVPTTGDRLGVLLSVTDDWHERRGKIEDFYKSYSDKTTLTSIVKKNLREELKSFRTFAKKPLNVLASSPNATNDDAAVFNVVLNRANPTHSVTPIKELCYAKVIALGGEKMESKCYTASDSNRASLCEGSDSVEIRYKIGTDAEAPTSFNDGTTSFISSKAIFILTCAGGRKKNLYSFHRWYNSKHPELSGVFDEMKTNLIL